RLAPAGELGVDEDDAVGRDERGGVAAAAGDLVEVVLHFLDLRDVRPLRSAPASVAAAPAASFAPALRRLESGRGDREAANDHQSTKQCHTSHDNPPEKNTRCTNQNAPAAITTIEPANARFRRDHSLFARSIVNAVATSTTTKSCPISTPILKEKSDQ